MNKERQAFWEQIYANFEGMPEVESDCTKVVIENFHPLTDAEKYKTYETPFHQESAVIYSFGRKWVSKGIIHGEDGKPHFRVRVDGNPSNKLMIEIASCLCPSVEFWDIEPDYNYRLLRSVLSR